MISERILTMPNFAHIPTKESNYGAARLAELEGLGCGPNLKDENLVVNEVGQEVDGRINSKIPERMHGQKRPNQTGFQKD
jgi:hypothetical protein